MNAQQSILQQMIQGCSERLYHKGDVLYAANEPFKGVFVMVAGAVKQVTLTKEGEALVTGFCLPGEWCGLAELSSVRYAGYAQVLDTSTVRQLPASLLEQLLSTPCGRRALYQLMSETIRNNKTRYFQINKARANVRLAIFIQDISQRFARLGYSPREFQLPMTRGDIGNYLGLTPETISRQIARMVDLNILTVSHRCITIQQPQTLDELIDNG
ncbi:hypothetical protein BL250_15440 [Erwinia sp. OLTSP20]|uniref:helix-turn-helix domain-containing protein n=1 Tax=unclassified Erwinia TaxID=2622719 RepID=UPI000C19BF72|nr:MULTISPECIES: helix-turn-helix domain-containing protein [unclassified Erwinia]PIJ48601.1 hypothetical protein BV501_16460 [Erwinia sp. OAMSP11]PIJ68955.1 hypothetical protein BK416_15700 [Erwinia sp. OLSSP12]PIJ78831.1 hypothetical protein BLD47_16555 [Erwinia sp. OLCASP19]PIJ79919.1 hypothetical protein BLD46_16350 [Erwinia sp. OLMTSP26]PIJ82037.1 hypothetical protein BLD49_15865 [Erwinia sp. OLMDSP33]